MINYLHRLLNRERDRWRSDHDYAEVMRSSTAAFLLRFLSFALIYLLQLLIARVYGAAEVGVFHLTVTILTIGMVLISAGTDTSLIRLIPELRTEGSSHLIPHLVNKVIAVTSIAAVVAGIGLWASAEWLARAIFTDDLLIVPLQIAALLLPCVLLTRLYAAAFRAEKKTSSSIWFEVLAIRVLHISGLLLMLLLFPLDSLYVMYTYGLAVTVTALWGAITWHRKAAGSQDSNSHGMVKEGATTTSTRIEVHQILSLSLPMYLSSSMVLLMDWTDTLLLGVFTTPEIVGIYSIVLKLSLLTSFSFASINTILLPKFSELYWSGDVTRLQKLVGTSNRLLFWTSAPMLIGLAFFAESFLSLFGAEFVSGGLSLLILCAGQFISSMTGNVIALLNMTGHQRRARDTLLISAAVNILGNCLLIPIWGMTGAAVATSLSMGVRDLLATRYASRVFGFRTWYLPTPIRRLVPITHSTSGERR
ncbi:flippase [Brevibacillus humidisoli]|uniref:flippase n=1 Tax=Brevibacillus humidisoli TaxID=2895522 RepID=UPI001E4B3C34|nr:flippase [Brevibacillus humidisoli]UFJ42508.1 flippase [Brevibacillus humidisoli]